MTDVRFLCAATAIAALAGVATADAQTARSRVDLGGHVNFLRPGDVDASNVAVGGRATVGGARWASLDLELNYAPKDTITSGPTLEAGNLGLIYRRRRVDAFAGARLGYRGDRIGVFAKVRPGLTRLSHQGVECGGDVCILALIAVPDYRTEFALDLGGVIEFYPSGRLITRIDLGDTLIRRRASGAPPFGEGTTHNLSSTFGLGFGF